MRAPAIAVIAIVFAAVLGAAAYVALRPETPPSEPPAPAQAAKPAGLKLYCQFYVFTEQRPRLALYFDVASRDGRPVFSQIYLAENNRDRTDYDGVKDPRPEWAYDPTPEPKTIASKVMIPDTSQAGLHEEDILIELYGYEPGRDQKAFFEASLKNIHYQNLPGKCRQSSAD